MKKFLTVTAIIGILLPNLAQAALTKSYDVENAPQMFLDTSVSSTATTGFLLSSPQLNGANYIFATTSGGVLRLRNPNSSFREDISYTSASVSAITNRVTLSGITRNICPQYTKTYVSCGNGRSWSKGTIVELNNDARLINLKMNNDRLNTTIDSGGILCGTTKQPCFFNNEITTTQRDNFKSWTTATGLHPFIFNSTTAVMQYWNGSSWINFGSGATVNATTTVRGGVQIGTISDQINKTNLGTSGAPVVVPTVNLTQSGSIHGTNNSYQAGRIPILNASGAISTSLGGTGLINSASGALLTGAGSGAMQIISATTASGKTITSNGKTWRAVPLPVRVLDSKVGVGTLFNNGDRLEKNFYQVAISGSVLTAGDQLKIHIAGDAINTTGGNPIFRVRVGAASGTIMCVTTNAPALASPGTFLINSNITVRTLGVTGTMAGDFELTDVTSTGESSYACATIGNITVNTTGSIRFTVTAQWPNTNNTQTIYYEQASLTRFSTP